MIDQIIAGMDYGYFGIGILIGFLSPIGMTLITLRICGWLTDKRKKVPARKNSHIHL